MVKHTLAMKEIRGLLMKMNILKAAFLMGILMVLGSPGMAQAHSDENEQPRWKVDLVESWEALNESGLKNWEKTEFEAPPVSDTMVLSLQDAPNRTESAATNR